MSDCQECKKSNYKNGWPQYNYFVGCYACAHAASRGFKDRFERQAHIDKYEAIIRRAKTVLEQAQFERNKAD